MRKVDENRAQSYIKRHGRYRKWMIFAICLSLLAGTTTFYMLNKPATAMTEQGAKQVGLVLETADSEYEQGLIKQMNEAENAAASAASSAEAKDEKKEENKDDQGAAAASTEASGASSESASSEASSGEGSKDDKDKSTGAGSSSSAESSSGDASNASSEASSGENSNDSSSENSGESSSTASSESSGEGSSDASAEASSQELKDEVKIAVVYEDLSGQEIAASKELSIEESFDLTTEVKGIEGYVFDKGKIDDIEITRIVKKSVSSDEENEDSASNGSSEETGKGRVIYEVTTTEGETREITEDSELHLVYYKANTEKELTASDEKVTVKAVLSDPSSLPEGVELTVAAIDSETEGYNYEAYMKALNDNADKISESDEEKEPQKYDEKNTLLYDIAFKLGGVEYQPKKGTVSIVFTLNENQLSTDIGVSKSEEVSVVHLPVNEEIMKNVDATSDATDINASDIQVELVKESSVDLTGDSDKVTFETNSFSAYAFLADSNGIVTWQGTQSMSAEDIARSLGDNTMFGAVAGTYESNGQADIEANIAVGTLKSIIDFGNSSTVYTHVSFDGYYVTKKSTRDGVFKFALFGTGNSLITVFDIEVKNGVGTVNLTDIVDKARLQSNSRLYVYELDPNYNLVRDGQSYNTANGITYTVTYDNNDFATENDNDLVGSFSSSYVENNVSGNNLYYALKHLEGNTVYVKDSDSSYTAYTYTQNNPNPAGVKMNGMFPISVSNMLDTAADTSQKLALLKDSDDVVVVNAIGTKDGFLVDVARGYLPDYTNNDMNYLTNDGFDIGNKLLVMNLDLTDCKEYTLRQFKVTNAKESAHTGNGWSEIANQIIINPVQRAADNSFVPYTGKLILDTVSGTIVAPRATVDVNNGAVPGTVIANYLIQGREIHKLTVRRYLDQQANITINNVAKDAKSINIKADKYIDGALAKASDSGKFSFSLVMLDKNWQGNYYWKIITQDIRNQGSTISYDIYPDMVGMRYGYDSSRASDNTYYFVLFENDIPSNQYSKDSTAILIKIKYYKGGEEKPLYYRIDAKESAIIQNDASQAMGYFNDQHRIGRADATDQFNNVAFYNETNGKSSLRIHKMVINDFGSGFVRDNTGTALLQNVKFRITNNSTKNYIVMTGFVGKAGDTGWAVEYSESTHRETGKRYLVTYNRSAQWTITDIPAGLYTVEEVADGITFVYDPYSNTSSVLENAKFSRVTKYDVTVDAEGGNYLGTGGNNYRAVFSADIPDHNDLPPSNVRVGYDTIENCSHTETVQVCNYYSIPVGPIQITKNFSGMTWTPDMAFTFAMTPIGYVATDSAGNEIALPSQPMPVDSVDNVARVTVTGSDATRNDDGTYSAVARFASIPFMFEGTYYYKITEENTQIAGVRYDTREYFVKVVVTKKYTQFNKSYTYDNMANPAKYTKDTTIREDFYYLGADIAYSSDKDFKRVLATCTLSLDYDPDTEHPENNIFHVEYTKGSVLDVVFNNTLGGELTVRKVWRDGQGNDISAKRTALNVEIWRRTAGSSWQYFTTTQLSGSNNWTQTITDLDITDEKGNLYEYCVKEPDDYLMNYQVNYTYNGKTYNGNSQENISVDRKSVKDTGYSMKVGADGRSYGEVTITNEAVYTNTLPTTGGVGTTPFTAAGIFMMLVAAICTLLITNYNKIQKGEERK